MRKILSMLAAASLAAAIFAAGANPSGADCDTPGSSYDPADPEGTGFIADNPATGGVIYGSQTSDTSGYIGSVADGDAPEDDEADTRDYLEANGGDSGGTISGQHAEAGVNGVLVVSDSPSICLSVQDNDVEAP